MAKADGAPGDRKEISKCEVGRKAGKCRAKGWHRRTERGVWEWERARTTHTPGRVAGLCKCLCQKERQGQSERDTHRRGDNWGKQGIGNYRGEGKEVDEQCVCAGVWGGETWGFRARNSAWLSLPAALLWATTSVHQGADTHQALHPSHKPRSPFIAVLLILLFPLSAIQIERAAKAPIPSLLACPGGHQSS